MQFLCVYVCFGIQLSWPCSRLACQLSRLRAVDQLSPYSAVGRPGPRYVAAPVHLSQGQTQRVPVGRLIWPQCYMHTDIELYNAVLSANMQWNVECSWVNNNRVGETEPKPDCQNYRSKNKTLHVVMQWMYMQKMPSCRNMHWLKINIFIEVKLRARWAIW